MCTPCSNTSMAARTLSMAASRLLRSTGTSLPVHRGPRMGCERILSLPAPSSGRESRAPARRIQVRHMVGQEDVVASGLEVLQSAHSILTPARRTPVMPSQVATRYMNSRLPVIEGGISKTEGRRRRWKIPRTRPSMRVRINARLRLRCRRGSTPRDGHAVRASVRHVLQHVGLVACTPSFSLQLALAAACADSDLNGRALTHSRNFILEAAVGGLSIELHNAVAHDDAVALGFAVGLNGRYLRLAAKVGRGREIQRSSSGPWSAPPASRRTGKYSL